MAPGRRLIVCSSTCVLAGVSGVHQDSVPRSRSGISCAELSRRHRNVDLDSEMKAVAVEAEERVWPNGKESSLGNVA